MEVKSDFTLNNTAGESTRNNLEEEWLVNTSSESDIAGIIPFPNFSSITQPTFLEESCRNKEKKVVCKHSFDVKNKVYTNLLHLNLIKYVKDAKIIYSKQ